MIHKIEKQFTKFIKYPKLLYVLSDSYHSFEQQVN